MRVKNKTELAKLGLKIDPNNPNQVVPLNQPTDSIPEDKVRNYQIFPDLSPNEEEVMRTSIKKVGVLDPIVKDEDGNTIDGHQRQRIAGELGVPCPEVVRHFGSEQEKFEYALNCNRARRRNLKQRQKRLVIATYLKADPEISNNWLAEILGVSDTTVIDVRKELEATSQIGKLKNLRSKDGKTRPATNKKNAAPKKKAKTKIKLAEIEPNDEEPDDEDDEYKPEPATDEDKRESANIFICQFGTNPELWAFDTYSGPEPEAILKAISYLIDNYFVGGWDAAKQWMATVPEKLNDVPGGEPLPEDGDSGEGEHVEGEPVTAEVGGEPAAASITTDSDKAGEQITTPAQETFNETFKEV